MGETLENAINSAPDGDILFELEKVMGGWCAYVRLTPCHGAIVPAERDSLFAHSGSHPTRAEALAKVPEVIAHLKSKESKDD